MEYGFISVLPALLVIALAIKTRRTLESLLCGCLVTYLIIAIHTGNNPVQLMTKAFFDMLMDYDTVWILVVCGLFGSLLAVIKASGGTLAIARLLEKKCRTQKSTLLISWLLGIIIFLDDYLNILTISACTRKLAEKQRIPLEALGYVIDSTGAPVCVLLPFSTWAIFFAGVFYEQESIAALGYDSAMQAYIHAIPYMFYAAITVIIVPLFITGVIPKLGAMKSYYKQKETNSQENATIAFLNAQTDSNLQTRSSIWNFIIPIGTVIAVQVLTDDMFWALTAALLASALLYIPRKRISGGKFCDLWIQGFADSVPVLAIVASALLMRKACQDIDLPGYVMSVIEPICSKQLYPVVAFWVVSILGFATGSSWGIPAVCAPIIIPLGASINANMLLVMGSIISGSTFTSHMCFYSDAIVMTSKECGIKNLDLFFAQMPYALIAFVLASIAFIIAGFIC